MKIFRNKRALSPVIAGIILIAVTVAVAISAAAWLGSMTISFMSVEELKITNCQWASDISYADLTVNNFGTESATINEVKVNGNLANNVTIISGSSTLDAGATTVFRVTQSFSPSTKYEFVVTTAIGTNIALFLVHRPLQLFQVLLQLIMLTQLRILTVLQTRELTATLLIKELVLTAYLIL